jgi:hypothetical protein
MRLLPFPYCLREGAGGRVKEAAIGKMCIKISFSGNGV